MIEASTREQEKFWKLYFDKRWCQTEIEL